MSDPVLSELHTKAVERVEARLAEYKATPSYKTLINDLRLASEVPITRVEAKPPKARDPVKIAAQMSALEKRLTATSQKEGSAHQPTPSAEARPYVMGDIDLSQKQPIKAFANHAIMLPADPRVFSDVALQAITEGKFYRNHARRLPKLMESSDTYLEIGAGVGFLAAQIAKDRPDAAIIAQEETRPLVAVADAIWRANGIEQTSSRQLSATPLFHADDAQNESTGLRMLMDDAKCSVLYLNDPRLTASVILTAVSTSLATPRHIVVGPRALAGFCDAETIAKELAASNYVIDADVPLSDAISLVRRPGR